MRILLYAACLQILLAFILAESGPFFTIEPLPVFASTGEVVEFECAASGVPPPRIVWYRNSKRIVIRGQISQETILFNHKKLRISGVRHEVDGGDYSCEADNKAGVIKSRTASLTAPYFLIDKDYFTQSPEPTYTRLPGTGIILPCQFDSKASWPEVQVYWRKLLDKSRFETVESSESRFISRSGTMVVSQSRHQDSGTYKCGVRNHRLGTISESRETKIIVKRGLPIEEPAKIYVDRQRVSELRGETAVLECIPYGTPLPEVVWAREGNLPLPEASVISESSNMLTVPAFSTNDEGRYYCSAQQNGKIIEQRHIDLVLLEVPEFPIPNRNLTVMENGTLNIPCDCLASPSPTISWFKNTEQILDVINEDNSLTLAKVNATSNGMYQCHCQNTVGNAQATFSVSVKGPARIVSHPADKTVPQGTGVTLTCEAEGSPTPSIIWLKDGKSLPSDTRIRQHENLYESTIYITDVRVSDNGVYECKALNENGDDSMKTKISVQGPPFINVLPRNTVGITGSDMLVPCEATASPLPVITWFRNEVQIWNDAKFAIKSQGLLIKTAHAVDGGSYMCQATNMKGVVSSSPVQVTVYNVPRIEHALPSTTNVTSGKTGLLLQCGITKDFSTYRWFRRGIPLLSVFYGKSKTPRIETRRGIGLYFHTVLAEDQGGYSCNVSNPAAAVSTSGYLYVDVIPEISFISPTAEVREYDNFWLDCLYSGEPKPKLTWEHNQDSIQRDHTIFANGTLRITSATRFDSGAYRCTVSNRQGSKSKDVIITVKSKARIENLPNLQYLITGQESIIVCEVSGYPFPTVEWRVNGKRIETFNSHGYSVRGTNLVINNPTRNVHDGLYTCKSSNDYGSDQQMSRVEVVDMPSISRVNGCGAVKAGLECEMMCEAAGSPLPDLSWRYKDGLNDSVIAVSDDVRHFVTMTDSEGAELRRLTFTIKDLREDDAGIYYCHAENRAGKTSKSYKLNVRYPPMIDTPPMLNYEFPIGATLTISCKARGEPPPRVTWRKEKGSLPPNGRSQVDVQGSLVIVNIQPEDVGQYTCTADNNNGNVDFQFDTVSMTTTVKVTQKHPTLAVIDNPIETWLIVVIIICILVVCIVVFVSVKMIRDRSREQRAGGHYIQQTNNKSGPGADPEPNYQYESVSPKPVMFQVPVDSSNSLPMYNLRTLNWSDTKPPNNFQSQFDDVDKQLQGLLKDLDNPKLDSVESDI